MEWGSGDDVGGGQIFAEINDEGCATTCTWAKKEAVWTHLDPAEH